MEAKAEQAGNLVHVRNVVGDLSGKQVRGPPQCRGRIYCGPFERVLNVNNDVDPAALRGIAWASLTHHSTATGP